MNSQALLAGLPRVDRLLDAPALAALPIRRALKRQLVHTALGELREALLAGRRSVVPGVDEVAEEVARRLDALLRPRPRPVLNATGVVLHTNLGRAPMDGAVVDAITRAAGACDLELDLASGARGSRFAHLRPLLAALLGAEDVHVVGNGAAALLLACTALAGAGGIALSRGQMVEIGDGFRVAAMAAAGGARLVEVGSTNRTHLADYAAALDPDPSDLSSRPASAFLWVHRANFRQEGFVRDVELAELCALARGRGVPVIADLGSGSLGEGVPGDEPTIAAALAAGADVITCSGDKLFGGPQAGLLAGRAATIERLRRHPMARALRPGKLTIAALHATAAAHAREGAPDLPLHRLLAADAASLRARAEALVAALGWPAEAIARGDATIGGGALPGEVIPGVALVVPGRGASASALARRLRAGDPPVLGRIHDDRLLLDLRSLPAEDDDALLAALRGLDRT
ncbi:MAG: L-seryl-tRNA(Sec) selenium transferase [Nannocystaceae bacterium]